MQNCYTQKKGNRQRERYDMQPKFKFLTPHIYLSFKPDELLSIARAQNKYHHSSIQDYSTLLPKIADCIRSIFKNLLKPLIQLVKSLLQVHNMCIFLIGSITFCYAQVQDVEQFVVTSSQLDVLYVTCTAHQSNQLMRFNPFLSFSCSCTSSITF